MTEDARDLEFYRELLRSVTEASPDLIYFKDTEHRLVHVGQTYAAIFDAEPADLVGKTARDLWPSEADAIIEDERRVLEGTKVIDRERLVTHPDGSEHWYSIYKLPRYDEDGDVVGFFAIDRDITERKELEQRLSVANRILRHDIRSAVNVIRGNARLAKAAETSPEVALDTIVAEAERLAELSTNARIIEEALSRDGRTERIQLEPLVRAKLQGLRERYPEAVVSEDIATDATVEASPRLDEALENVLTNAVVHNDADTPAVTAAVIRNEDGTGTVEIRVTDNGPGIPRDEIEPIRTGLETDLVHTSGLGLWVVKWIVEASGGTLRFEANEPRGSVVAIQLPRA